MKTGTHSFINDAAHLITHTYYNEQTDKHNTQAEGPWNTEKVSFWSLLLGKSVFSSTWQGESSPRPFCPPHDHHFL